MIASVLKVKDPDLRLVSQDNLSEEDKFIVEPLANDPVIQELLKCPGIVSGPGLGALVCGNRDKELEKQLKEAHKLVNNQQSDSQFSDLFGLKNKTVKKEELLLLWASSSQPSVLTFANKLIKLSSHYPEAEITDSLGFSENAISVYETEDYIYYIYHVLLGNRTMSLLSRPDTLLPTNIDLGILSLPGEEGSYISYLLPTSLKKTNDRVLFHNMDFATKDSLEDVLILTGQLYCMSLIQYYTQKRVIGFSEISKYMERLTSNQIGSTIRPIDKNKYTLYGFDTDWMNLLRDNPLFCGYRV